MDLHRRRIVPPSGMVGPLSSDFLVEQSQVDFEEESCGAINSGSYLTNLMANGFSDPFFIVFSESHDTPQPDDIAGEDHGPTATKGPQRRSKNFSVHEDTLIVSTWLNVSMDDINGVDQSRSCYWKRIHDYFHATKKFASDRSEGSLMNCWSDIQNDVDAFAGYLSKIEARNHSGWLVT